MIDSEHYLLSCYRFIELNPVRAQDMVDEPAEYPWSSYRYNALGMKNRLITPHDEYLKLASSNKERKQAYRSLFNNPLAEKTLEEIREATNKAWVLGSSHLKDKIQKQLNRQLEPKAKGGDRKSKAYHDNIKINRV